MYTVERAGGPLPTVTLADASAASVAAPAPERGGMIIGFFSVDRRARPPMRRRAAVREALASRRPLSFRAAKR